ncbi:hypothetical protein B0J15DRAFT_483716 [Fusarium solani]|uniref:DUF6536 domain-containing protein n=1 Tax=Fusarium solani TaxID=169388 RepID=A0A9P9R9N4_FUSSL|nr:uncharacterized protein B0J15DRAFT_483716 [Fusarium solani]KAH7270937.1 hypothetical protein B0J15DRAFT_483716 [Fusarium solani]
MRTSGYGEIEAQPFLQDPKFKKRSKWAEISSGWRLSLVYGAGASTVVLLINLGVTIWSSTLKKGDENSRDSQSNNRRTLFQGSCEESRKLNVVLHIFINVFSSILLAASSYGMQCLTAPNRAEVDKSHAAQRWMDIGILSVRNLRGVSWKRSILWFLLTMSSIPLHLLYNSVVFSSLSTMNYDVYRVGEQFNDPRSANITKLAREQKWDNITAEQCITDYGVAFLTSRSDVILVVDQAPKTNGSKIFGTWYQSHDLIVGKGCYNTPYSWICPGINCNAQACLGKIPDVKKKANDWRPFEHHVKYCLSKPREEICRINFNIPVAVGVIIANAAKAIILLYMAFSPPEEPLLVLGDAIHSFLKKPDPFSKHICLASIHDVKTQGAWASIKPSRWVSTKRRWAAAISRTRWWISGSLYGLALGVAIFFLAWGITALSGSHSAKTLWEMGFGAITDKALISGLQVSSDESDKEILTSVLLANIPQITFSVLYFQYNGLFTCMLSAKEWSDFGWKRKALRVSSEPVGEQRSRYFLQLPYRWSIPLVLLSILMHWILSQSIFVVAVETDRPVRDYNAPPIGDWPRELSWNFATCGYSPVAIICVMLVSLVMVTAVVITATRRLPTAIPVVGSCSLAIAASCHHPDGVPQPEAPYHPLKWGVMGKSETDVDGVYLHCGFSTEEVGEPQDGLEYQ